MKTIKNVSTIGIDLAKNFIQVHGIDDKGRVVIKRKLRRSNFLNFMANTKKCDVAMEACSSSHFWAKKLNELGHNTKILPGQHVKPFVKSNKDDAADAEAIAEASLRPNIRPIPQKTTAQLDFQALLKIRARYVKNKVQIAHEMRALLIERGIFCKKGINPLKKLVQNIIKDIFIDPEITLECKITLADLYNEFLNIEERIAVIEKRISKQINQNATSKALLDIPGVGIITVAAVIAAVPDPNAFKNGRQFAAWLGLVPKHTGTGGKNKNIGLSKRGNSYLRALLVQGANAMKRAAKTRGDNFSRWVIKLKEKKRKSLVTIAVANKMARVIWAILASERGLYIADKAAAKAA